MADSVPSLSRILSAGAHRLHSLFWVWGFRVYQGLGFGGLCYIHQGLRFGGLCWVWNLGAQGFEVGLVFGVLRVWGWLQGFEFRV
jgi:hypothetical protein